MIKSIIFLLLIFIMNPCCVYASPKELQEKAELFNQTMDTSIWFEQTISLTDRSMEKARKLAEFIAPIKAKQLFRNRIVQTKALKLTKEMIDFSELIKITDEDTSGIYGKPYQVNVDGKTISMVTFRFKMQCEKVKEINPFIKKSPYHRPSMIREFKERDDDWQIVAVGYGFYESFGDIDSKVKIAKKIGIDSACKAIRNKMIELGITDTATQNQIIKTIKAKKDYGGVYRVLGCGVEVDAPIPIRINKKDYSVSFMY